MTAQKTAVIATDLTDAARPAAEWARRYAEAEGARIVVVHVIDLSVSHWLEGVFNYVEAPERKEQSEEVVRTWYREVTGTEPDALSVRAGAPTLQIAEAVKAHDAGLLIIARSGRRPLQRALLGSTAKGLAIDPPCELVIVHPHHDRPDVRDIVVGTDFSANGDRALSVAAAVAHHYGARLHLVHAEEYPRVNALESPYGWTIPEEFRRKDSLGEASARMQSLEQQHARELEGIRYDTLVVQGPPDAALIECCQENRSDLLVIGRAGHSPMVSKFLGTVVNQLVHATPSSLLISPPP